MNDSMSQLKFDIAQIQAQMDEKVSQIKVLINELYELGLRRDYLTECLSLAVQEETIEVNHE